MHLRPFQKKFLAAALSPDIDTAALSLPRGNGKSALAGHLVSRILDPADDLFRRGTESVLCAASIEQARIVFRFARETLEPTGEYRFLDSHTRIGITHKATGTKLRVIGSNGKTAMGLVGTPWAICDEPGAWEVNGGLILHDAIQTAQGKPGSPLKALYIGTLAPAQGGWWHELVSDGSRASTHVTALQGDPERWDRWPTIRKANPLTAISPAFRRKLIEERDDAKRDSRLKGRFLRYRLNIPAADEATLLLTADDFRRSFARPEGIPAGKPVVGIDLGGGRAWSAAVAMWSTGRVECLAIAPGVPDLAGQETRDRVPRGTYRKLADAGELLVADGFNVPPVSMVVEAIRARWGQPDHLVCDRFRLGELQDHARGILIVPRVARWSEASEDIRATRRLFLDGPLHVAKGSRALLAASCAAAMVQNDSQGSMRLVKRDGSNNTGRDDVAAALVLAAGQLHRYLESRTQRRGAYLGLVQ